MEARRPHNAPAVLIEAPENYPPVLCEMLQFVGQTLVEEGIDVPLARRAAFATCERIRREYGGQPIYLTAGHFYELSLREEEIYRKFSGDNYNELASEFGVTPRWVRELVKRARARDLVRRQIALPGLEPGKQ
jgi:Mor family transcriptional regulator